MPRLTSIANRVLQAVADTLLRADRAHPLNAGRDSHGTAAPDIAAELRSAIGAMKAEAFDTERGTVDYGRLREGASYAEYRACTTGLIALDPSSLVSREEKLAFWINLYNALVIDAVIAFGLKESVRENLGFFRRAAYVIGGLRYSADDIEHGILRENRRHPLPLFPLQFATDDPRRAIAIRPMDVRVHCALSCASRSCPAVSAFDAGSLDQQLDTAARSFVNGGAVTVSEANGVVISPIFRWYKGDFGGREGVREFLLRHLDDGPARELLSARSPRISYQRYDWSLNRL